jgi:dUTPase
MKMDTSPVLVVGPVVEKRSPWTDHRENVRRWPPALPFETEGWGQFVSYDKTLDIACTCDKMPPLDDCVGVSLCAKESKVVPAHGSALVPTGLALQLSPGYYGKIEGRGDLAHSHRIVPFGELIENGSEIRVLLFNHAAQEYMVKMGQPIARLLFHADVVPTLFRVDEL